MLSHYLAQVKSLNFHALIFEHTPNFNALSLRTCCFNFQLLLIILYKQQTILSKPSVVN